MNITYEIARIIEFVFKAVIHILPFFILSIIIAAGVNQFKITDKIVEALKKNVKTTIVMATIVGAISPLCSCGVIPTIYSFLVIGIPIAPIMSFWLTSPIMSPEAFLLTWGQLGLELAIVRLLSTIFIGLTAGYAALRIFPMNIHSSEWLRQSLQKEDKNCGCSNKSETPVHSELPKIGSEKSWKDFFIDVKKISFFLGGWLLLAFLLEAFITFYVPEKLITQIFSMNNLFSVVWGAIVGIPVYINNISAIPIINGLLGSGMGKGAALAFLLAGPITSVPAIIAVFGIVKRKVFFTFLAIGFTLSVFCGYMYELILHILK